MSLEINNPQNSFEQEIQARQGVAVEDVNALIDQQLDWSMRSMGDMAHMADVNLRHLYLQKAQELSETAKSLKGKLDQKEILVLQENILLQLKQRMGLILEIAGGKKVSDTISTPQEMATLVRSGIPILQNTDVNALVNDYLKKRHPEIQPVEESLRPDTYELLKKVQAGTETLSEKDWGVLAYYLAALENKDLSPRERNVALALLEVFKTEQRAELLDHVPLNQDLPNLCADLVSSTYLTAEQVEKKFLPKLEALQKDPKTNKEAIVLMLQTLERVKSPAVQNVRQKMEEVRKKTPAQMEHMSYGQRNTARELLTGRGAISLFGLGAGAMTASAAILMDLSHPSSIPSNRALWIGAAEMAVGLEGTRGLAGLTTKPSQVLARFTSKQDEAQDDQQKLERATFGRDFTNNPLAARFYYTYADKIAEAYKKAVDEKKSAKPHLKLTDIGINWKDLPEVYKNHPAEYFEENMSKWAAEFPLKFGTKNAGSERGGQRWLMNELRKESGGLNDSYTIDPELEKLIKPAQ